LYKSVVRSAAGANHQNKRVTYKPDVKEMIEKLDVTSNNVLRRKQRNRMMMKQAERGLRLARNFSFQLGHSSFLHEKLRTRIALKSVITRQITNAKFFKLKDSLTY
jgi:hypothetical protein